MKNTYNEKIELIKELYDNSQIDDAWQLFNDTVLDYVTSRFWYRKSAKIREETSDGKGSTFISDRRALVSNKHTRSLFETWIGEYHQTYKKVNNTFIWPKRNLKDCNTKFLNGNNYIDHLRDWLYDGKYSIHHDYLTDQLILRGFSISMGHTTFRRVSAIILYTLTDQKAGRYEPLIQDIGIRIATDPIIIDVINLSLHLSSKV